MYEDITGDLGHIEFYPITFEGSEGIALNSYDEEGRNTEVWLSKDSAQGFVEAIQEYLDKMK